MRVFRLSLSLAVSAALTMTGLSTSASAQETIKTHSKSQHIQAGVKPMAAGLIVKTTGRRPAAAILEKTDVLLRGKAHVKKVTPVTKNTNALTWSGDVTLSAATVAAKELQKRDDVIWAAPNVVRQRLTNNPAVKPNDPKFPNQLNVWDTRDAANPQVDWVFGGLPFPRGGFSVKAPDLWQVTKGSPNVVVAVLDTGSTPHPDLAGQWVPGYDMISADPGSSPESYFVSNDGNGRDDNPSDPGDWILANQCDGTNPAEHSSWHGSHVAGIVAAKADNGIGVTGIAPGVKVQPVRVLGRCGGTDADIVSGITWAAGGHVDGVPDNATPANVINLSLGSEFPCTQPYVDAIDFARTQGALVVAAAGNGNAIAQDWDADKVSPANCPGAFSVAATDEYGLSTSYSNVGSTVDVSAPGGENSWDGRGILSTVNLGTTSPLAGAGYAEEEGTSMAAPAVSAAAALFFSLGFSVDQVDAGLRHAVQPFTTNIDPEFGDISDIVCHTNTCGAGVLDLSAVPWSVSPPTVSGYLGEPQVGQVLTAAHGHWLPGNSPAFAYQWYADSVLIDGETGSTLAVGVDDLGSTLSVRESSTQTGFPTLWSQSMTMPPVRKPSTTVLSLPSTSGRYGTPMTTNVTVASEGESPTGVVQILKGSMLLAYGPVTDGAGTVVIPGTKLPMGSSGLTAKFVGAGSVGTSVSAPKTVSVAKALSTVAFSLPTTVKKAYRAKVTVYVRAKGVKSPTGTVRVYDGSKRIYSFTMWSGNFGTRTIYLPRFTTRGKHKIKVIYLGNSYALAKSSVTKTITVK